MTTGTATTTSPAAANAARRRPQGRPAQHLPAGLVLARPRGDDLAVWQVPSAPRGAHPNLIDAQGAVLPRDGCIARRRGVHRRQARAEGSAMGRDLLRDLIKVRGGQKSERGGHRFAMPMDARWATRSTRWTATRATARMAGWSPPAGRRASRMALPVDASSLPGTADRPAGPAVDDASQGGSTTWPSARTARRSPRGWCPASGCRRVAQRRPVFLAPARPDRPAGIQPRRPTARGRLALRAGRRPGVRLWDLARQAGRPPGPHRRCRRSPGCHARRRRAVGRRYGSRRGRPARTQGGRAIAPAVALPGPMSRSGGPRPRDVPISLAVAFGPDGATVAESPSSSAVPTV